MSANPARTLLDYAWEVYVEEENRCADSNGRPLPRSNALQRYRDRGIHLSRLGSALMTAAHKTGFPPPEVEKRIKDLEDAVDRVLEWEIPKLWPESERGRPPSEYLNDQLSRLIAAIDPVRRLAEYLDGQQTPAVEEQAATTLTTPGPGPEQAEGAGKSETDNKPAAKKKQKRAGRPKVFDQKADERLARDWQASGLPSLKDFARERGLSFNEVKRAIERDRARIRRQHK